MDASIELFGGDVRRDFRYGCEAGLLPIDVAVDRLGLISRELPHVPTIAMRASDRLRDAPPGWPTFVRRMCGIAAFPRDDATSEEHTSALQSLMRNSYAVFCLQKKTITHTPHHHPPTHTHK